MSYRCVAKFGPMWWNATQVLPKWAKLLRPARGHAREFLDARANTQLACKGPCRRVTGTKKHIPGTDVRDERCNLHRAREEVLLGGPQGGGGPERARDGVLRASPRHALLDHPLRSRFYVFFHGPKSAPNAHAHNMCRSLDHPSAAKREGRSALAYHKLSRSIHLLDAHKARIANLLLDLAALRKRCNKSRRANGGPNTRKMLENCTLHPTRLRTDASKLLRNASNIIARSDVRASAGGRSASSGQSQFWPKLTRTRSDVGQTWPTFGRRWPHSGRILSSSATGARKSIENMLRAMMFELSRSDFGASVQTRVWRTILFRVSFEYLVDASAALPNNYRPRQYDSRLHAERPAAPRCGRGRGRRRPRATPRAQSPRRWRRANGGPKRSSPGCASTTPREPQRPRETPPPPSVRSHRFASHDAPPGMLRSALRTRTPLTLSPIFVKHHSKAVRKRRCVALFGVLLLPARLPLGWSAVNIPATWMECPSSTWMT